MGFFDFFRREQRDMTPAQLAQVFQTDTAKVTADTALFCSAFAAALRVRAETFACLPVDCIRTSGESRINDTTHPVALMYANGPNPTMTWPQFARWVSVTEDLRGEAFAEVEWKGGRPQHVWPLHGSMEVKAVGREVVYHYRSGSESRPIPAASVMHFKSAFLTADGLRGRSLVEIAAQSIGIEVNAERLIAKMFANGNHFSTYLYSPEKLEKDLYESLSDQLADGAGLLPAGKTRIFQKVKPESLGFSMKDADMAAIRKRQLEAISGVTRVPLVFLGNLDSGTQANTEQQGLMLVRDCVQPSVVDREAVMRRVLFVGADAGRYQLKFNLSALVRGDFKSRMEGYEIGIRIGHVNPNETRALEDLPPYEGGDVYVMQAQMIPVPDLGTVNPIQPEQARSEKRTRPVERRAGAAKRLQLTRQWRPVFADAARRIVRREVNDVRREAERVLSGRSQRTADDLKAWLEDYYGDGFKGRYAREMAPVVSAFADALAQMANGEVDGDVSADDVRRFAATYVEKSAKRHSASSQGQLAKLLDDPAALDAITARLDEWDEKRADKMADRESVDASGALVRMAFISAGVATLEWVNTSEKSCPFCEQMDGVTVGIELPFASEGDEIDGGERGALSVTGARFHPPLHEGCQCQVVPG